MTMAPAACPSLHELEGHCEYCGEVCDSTQDELNAIDCTFEGCPSPTMYHQHCIETYLKAIRLDKQRKTGFQCPRGCGKGSNTDKPCPGRVTKSHPIHARNDSSKKRRKAKMPEIIPLVVPAKKEKEVKPQQMSSSKSAKVENTVPKLLVLNRASTSPSLPGNIEVPKPSARSSNYSNALVKALPRESTVAAAIAAARSEIAASKRGSSAKSNIETYMSGRSEYSATTFDSRSNQNSESDDDSLRQLMIPRRVLPVGRGVEAAPVINAWARGRCTELLNGFKQTDLKSPAPHLAPPNASHDTNIPTSSTSIPRPPVVKQPTSAERVGGSVGEEDDLETRQLKARTKNEKKHLQRAAKTREKREAEEAAAALAATSAPTAAMQNGRQPGQPDSYSNSKQCSESFESVIRHRKFSALVKQLQEYGFTDWQSNLAVRICGSDVEQCVDWLLRNASSMQTDMPVYREQKMDITSEVYILKEVMHSEGFSQEQVKVAVISTDGDVDAALRVLRTPSSYWNSSGESSQGTVHNVVSPNHSFGQALSQSSSDLTTAMWDGMLNSAADYGQDFSPLSGSMNGSDYQKSFGPFATGIVSDLARYNALVSLGDASGNRARNAGYYETPSSYEMTASTVTSVAAAVLNDTFGFDEQLISCIETTPVDSAVNAVPSLNGIWSYPSSTFTGQSFLNAPFGVKSNAQWNQQPVKSLVDEAAEEQDLLMSELLSHLLV